MHNKPFMKIKLLWVVTFFQLIAATASAELMNVKAPLTHCRLAFDRGGLRGEGGQYINLP